jgi:Family of unknown function (DUF6011)
VPGVARILRSVSPSLLTSPSHVTSVSDMSKTTGTPEHTAKCRKCHRTLRSPASIAAGIGPRCAAIEAAFWGLNDAQQEKAADLIADRGIVKVRDGIYEAVADDGEGTYLVSVNGNCGCDWGRRRVLGATKFCAHAGAARLLDKPAIRFPATRSDLAEAA